jgi:hypothetical protein
MNIQFHLGNTVHVALSRIFRRNCVVRDFYGLVALIADVVLAPLFVDWRDPADGVRSSFPLLSDCEGDLGLSEAVNCQCAYRQLGLVLVRGNLDHVRIIITILDENAFWMDHQARRQGQGTGWIKLVVMELRTSAFL